MTNQILTMMIVQLGIKKVVAQEIYYDAPELRHLVHRGKSELDEEGNSILLP